MKSYPGEPVYETVRADVEALLDKPLTAIHDQDAICETAQSVLHAAFGTPDDSALFDDYLHSDLWLHGDEQPKPDITTDTPVDTALLTRWLTSGDPRHIAWAADFARRNNDASVIARMPELIERWNLSPTDRQANAAQIKAFRAVVDTLIQTNAQVPISTIQAMAGIFPDESLILIRRLPWKDAAPTLNGWIAQQENQQYGSTLARGAILILARHPRPALVDRILLIQQNRVDIDIYRNPNDILVAPKVISFCPSSRQVNREWPQLYGYRLSTAYRQAENDEYTIADLGSYRAFVYRFPKPRGGCGPAPWNDAETWHRLLAYWLGTAAKNAPWQFDTGLDFKWTNKADFEQKKQALIETEKKKMLGTAKALHARGLLTDRMLASYAPNVTVSVQCFIHPCPIKVK